MRQPNIARSVVRIAASCFAALLFACAATSAPSSAATVATEPVLPEGAFHHLRMLQEIATANGGNRAAGTPGYDRSADYVAEKLRAAGYTVRFEEFSFPFFEERNAAGADGG